tara:strand:- start:1072 stop:1440 length:369 start_codon:yes stop_codon:yes gene_type:complete
MRINKAKEINLFKSKIIKIFDHQKKKFSIKEIYSVQMKGKQLRKWRQHMNCKKILFCINGIFKVEFNKKNKIIKKIIKVNNFLEIPKKTIFRFESCSSSKNILIVLSDKSNNNLITKKNFIF